MSMSLTDAKIYVAKIAGAHNDPRVLDQAADSIKATYGKWNSLRDWYWLLEDSSRTVAIAGCIIADAGGGSGTVVTNATAGALFGINVGQTVTGTGIPADTTVASVTETVGAGVATFTLSASSTAATITMTFSADIPVITDQQIYNMPSNFKSPYSARLLTNARSLEYVEKRKLDRIRPLQTGTGTPSHYTVYQGHTFDVAAQHWHIQLFRIPGQNDTLLLRWYRRMNDVATTIDIPDDYLYTFLDDASAHVLHRKHAGDSRLPDLRDQVRIGINRAVADDNDQTEDENLRFISQIEAVASNSPDFSI